jgi:hypothetical protein
MFLICNRLIEDPFVCISERTKAASGQTFGPRRGQNKAEESQDDRRWSSGTHTHTRTHTHTHPFYLTDIMFRADSVYTFLSFNVISF